MQQHLSACTKHLAGLRLARDKARRLSHQHIFKIPWTGKGKTAENPYFKPSRFQKKTPFSGLHTLSLATAVLASSNLKRWLPQFCFLLFAFLLPKSCASRKMPRSPRFAVVQARYTFVMISLYDLLGLYLYIL